jgi:hypothetical protein
MMEVLRYLKEYFEGGGSSSFPLKVDTSYSYNIPRGDTSNG